MSIGRPISTLVFVCSQPRSTAGSSHSTSKAHFDMAALVHRLGTHESGKVYIEKTWAMRINGAKHKVETLPNLRVGPSLFYLNARNMAMIIRISQDVRHPDVHVSSTNPVYLGWWQSVLHWRRNRCFAEAKLRVILTWGFAALHNCVSISAASVFRYVSAACLTWNIKKMQQELTTRTRQNCTLFVAL